VVRMCGLHVDPQRFGQSFQVISLYVVFGPSTTGFGDFFVEIAPLDMERFLGYNEWGLSRGGEKAAERSRRPSRT